MYCVEERPTASANFARALSSDREKAKRSFSICRKAASLPSRKSSGLETVAGVSFSFISTLTVLARQALRSCALYETNDSLALNMHSIAPQTVSQSDAHIRQQDSRHCTFLKSLFYARYFGPFPYLFKPPSERKT